MALSKTQIAQAPTRKTRLAKICEALPEVSAQPVGEGHVAFAVRKRTFAYLLVDHHGDGKIALCCKSTLEEQRGMVAEEPERFYVPAYLGPKGWISLRLDLADVDWAVVEALVRAAYVAAAPRGLAEQVAHRR